jgi:heme/copper-type cytochrome/quinol oxidase subunit 2
MLFIILSMIVILGSVSAFTFYIMNKYGKNEKHGHHPHV